jgi:hypothetical protein
MDQCGHLDVVSPLRRLLLLLGKIRRRPNIGRIRPGLQARTSPLRILLSSASRRLEPDTHLHRRSLRHIFPGRLLLLTPLFTSIYSVRVLLT